MFPDTFNPLLKSPSQLTFLFEPNATMNYHDSKGRNNERNHLDSFFSFKFKFKFKFIYI